MTPSAAAAPADADSAVSAAEATGRAACRCPRAGRRHPRGHTLWGSVTCIMFGGEGARWSKPGGGRKFTAVALPAKHVHGANPARHDCICSTSRHRGHASTQLCEVCYQAAVRAVCCCGCAHGRSLASLTRPTPAQATLVCCSDEAALCDACDARRVGSGSPFGAPLLVPRFLWGRCEGHLHAAHFGRHRCCCPLTRTCSPLSSRPQRPHGQRDKREARAAGVQRGSGAPRWQGTTSEGEPQRAGGAPGQPRGPAAV